MKKIKRFNMIMMEKMTDFSKYSLFAALICFLLFLLMYRQPVPCIVLAVVLYVFLKFTHFVYEIILKVLGEVGK